MGECLETSRARTALRREVQLLCDLPLNILLNFLHLVWKPDPHFFVKLLPRMFLLECCSDFDIDGRENRLASGVNMPQQHAGLVSLTFRRLS